MNVAASSFDVLGSTPDDPAGLLPPGEGLPPIDWHKVADRLASAGLALDLATPPRRFDGGLANINIAVRVNGDWAVLRRPPPGPLPKGAHDMAREHRVLSALAEPLPLAPRSLHFCDDDSIAGAPFQLLEYRAGSVVRADRLDPLPDTAETGKALAGMMIGVLADIHAVDATAPALAGLGRPEGFLARNAAGWIARAGAVGAADDPQAAAVADWLQAFAVEEAEAPVLLHNDFKLDNIILDPATLAPRAVVDWDMATRGDPLLDLATLLSYWVEREDPAAMHSLAQMPTAHAGFPTREAAAAAYAARTGRSLDRLLFPRVLAIFRLGVVFRQLAVHRPHDPRVSGVDASGLFAFARDVMQGRRF